LSGEKWDGAAELRAERSRDQRAGFSILELAIALALITVAAAIAIPLVYSRPAITLDNAAVLLARDLRAAQNEAVHRRADVYVHFFADGTGYRVFDEGGRAIANPTGAGDLVRRYTADAVFEGVRLVSVETGPRKLARFTPDGLAVRGGVVVLEYQGDRRILTLHEGSGLVEITGLERPWIDTGL
jgi:prepilin-type N-terminal cleavage/methylation domain-containing protein